MSNDVTRKDPNLRKSWLTIVLIVVVLGIVWFLKDQESRQVATNSRSVPVDTQASTAGDGELSVNRPDEDQPTTAEVMPDHEPISKPVVQPDTSAARKAESQLKPLRSPQFSSSDNSDVKLARNPISPYLITNQVIHDLDGKVVYRGTIDLKPTLDRIERGDSNRHRNDGATFQNREGRLPRKPTGYYKEYVNPTKGLNGPGPQRIIIGQQGEVWYTADHYKSFRQIKTVEK